MSWLRRPRYAVAGVPPTGTTDGWDGYRGASLADRPVVAAALDRAPRSFADLIYEPGSTELALSRAQLLEHVTVATRDGVAWELSLGEDVKPVVDTGPDTLDEDMLLAALAGRPGVVTAAHPDREVLTFRTAAPVHADEALALCLDAISAAHRELARRLRIDVVE